MGCLVGMADENSGESDATARMIQTGCMWLNSAFRIKVPKNTVGGRWFSFRADYGEMAWGFLFALIVFLVQFTLWNMAGRQSPGPLYLIWSPMTWPVYGFLAFMFGRKMAHISPYRSYSGESATQWATIVLRKSFGRLMSKMGYSDIVYNRVKTTMRDKAEHQFRVTWAREWLGIAPAPYAPHVSNPNKRAIHNEIGMPLCEDIDVYPDNRNMLQRYSQEYLDRQKAQQIRRRIEESDISEDVKDILS